MGLGSLLFTALALSMDAFAVSICKGLSMRQLKFKTSFIVGLYFGLFQALMPLLGFVLGMQFSKNIEFYSHWFAFALLSIIGLKMVKDSFDDTYETDMDSSLDLKIMLPLSVATSIDAFVAGISFALLDLNIYSVVIGIGLITLTLSMLGVKIGSVFGCKYKSKAEFMGGLSLVLIGIKTLFEHTGLLEKILRQIF